MNLGLLCQIILKSDKEISGYGPLAQHVIFAYQSHGDFRISHSAHCTSPAALPL